MACNDPLDGPTGDLVSKWSMLIAVGTMTILALVFIHVVLWGMDHNVRDSRTEWGSARNSEPHGSQRSLPSSLDP